MITVPTRLTPTQCAICDTRDNATELYPEFLPSHAFTPSVYSARRRPDRIHYRLARCRACGLVRSDPVADEALIQGLYADAEFTYGSEVRNLNRTYGRYLAQLERYGVRRGSLLEIGCGSGFFLEEATRQGYSAVTGVEPTREAVESADPAIRPYIKGDVMRPGLFDHNHFDVVCLFQVLDHLADPVSVLRECFQVLKRGGLLLTVTHDVEAWQAKLLGSRSPIVDVEHTYLYSQRTMTQVLEKCGFEVKKTGAALNFCSLGHLTGLLAPMLGANKNAVMNRISFWVSLGNLYAVGAKV